MTFPADIGFGVKEGAVSDIVPGSPADKAGLVPGAKFLTVGDRPYSDQGAVIFLAG